MTKVRGTQGQGGARDGTEIWAVSASMTEDTFRASIRDGRLYLSISATEQLLLPFETASTTPLAPEVSRKIVSVAASALVSRIWTRCQRPCCQDRIFPQISWQR